MGRRPLHPKIVFPDDLPPGELPEEYKWPATERWKGKKQAKKQAKKGKQPRPHSAPYVKPGPHLYFNPMTMPSRIMNGWSDDALYALWQHSFENGQIKGIYGQYQFQLRRNKAPEYETRVMSDEDRECCFRIVEYTSSEAYKASSIGWHAISKQAEMASDRMVYLLVRAPHSSDDGFPAENLRTDIVAFISFRIENDDEPYQWRQVLYIYEVHVAEKFRGKGLGRWLVFTVEAMAQSISIHKTMLTVFTSNKGAIKAYKKMGYTKDQASPPDRKVRNRVIKSDYLIMGKRWNSGTGEIQK